MEETELITSAVVEDEKEDEEEEGEFQFNYVPEYKKDTRQKRKNTTQLKKEKIEEVNNDQLNIQSDDTLISIEDQKENYYKAIASGTGDIATKERSNFFGIEYSPEHLKGKVHWRNSLVDFKNDR